MNKELFAVDIPLHTQGGQITYIPKPCKVKLNGEESEDNGEDTHVRVRFRIISADSMIGADIKNKSSYFPSEVLKKAVSKFSNVPARIEHNDENGLIDRLSQQITVIGTIENPEFVESYTNIYGVKIPAGIEADFVVNRKANEKLAELLKDPNNPIRFCSAQVKFMGYPSNPEDYKNGVPIGRRNEKNELLHWVAEEILAVPETSLVNYGADPFASKKAANGQVIYQSFSKNAAGEVVEEELAVFTMPDAIREAAIQEKFEALHTNLTELQAKNAELGEKYAAASVELDKIRPELDTLRSANDTLKKQNAEALETVKVANDRAVNLTTSFEAVQSQMEELRAERETDKVKLGLYDQMVEETRQEVKRLYSVSVQGKTDSAIDKTIDEADYATLKALETQYYGIAEALQKGVDVKSATNKGNSSIENDMLHAAIALTMQSKNS